MFKNKKSSLSLSINAIVILILAITMLGLALGFIRTMFGKASTQMEALLGEEPPPLPASSGQPLTVSRTSIIGRPGEKIVLKFGVYNPTAGTLTSQVAAPAASNLNIKTCSSLAIVSTGSKSVGANNNEEIFAVFSLPTTIGMTVCTIELYKSATEKIGAIDVVLNVRTI